MPPSASRTICWPLTAAIVLLAAVFVHVSSPRLPLGEAGFWAILTAAVYTILPLAVGAALNGEFTPLNDSRLFTLQPRPELFARIGWYHVAYLASLSVVYALLRAPTSSNAIRPPRIDRAQSTALLCVFGVAMVLVVLFRPDASDGGYGAGYLAVQQLPLVVRQLLRLIGGVRLFLGIGALVWAFGSWRSRRVYVFAAIILLLALTVTTAGERTTLALGVVAGLVLYHRYVRPIRTAWFILIGVAGLLVFTALGLYRTYLGLEDRTGFAVVPGAGEFEIVFANAVDLADRRASGQFVPPPVSVRVADFVGPIPSQLLPFTKSDPADWFLQTYYPELRDRGGGLAFGVVAEGVIGFGVVELLLRGLAMGALFVGVDRWADRRRRSFWPIVAQTWVLLFTYETVRVSSLSPLSSFVQQFSVAVGLVWLTRQLLLSRKAIVDVRESNANTPVPAG